MHLTYFLKKDPIMQDVFMDDPDTNSMPYTDALVAFWPGLQVIMGDLKPAISYHQVLYHILRRNHFIPEAFRDNYQVSHIYVKGLHKCRKFNHFYNDLI